MKYKTALKQSVASVKFLVIAITVMIFLTIRFPGAYTGVPLAIFVLYLAADVYNIYRIRRASAKDPTFLDRKL